jgi:hypothetical protein
MYVCMVIDCHLLNKKVVFNAFPMPAVEHAFDSFHNSKVFSVLDLNSTLPDSLVS